MKAFARWSTMMTVVVALSAFLGAWQERPQKGQIEGEQSKIIEEIERIKKEEIRDFKKLPPQAPRHTEVEKDKKETKTSKPQDQPKKKDGEPKKGESKQDGKVYCEAKLQNGSFIKGSTSLEKVKLETKFNSLDIPIRQIKTIKIGDVSKEEKDTVETTEGKYGGWVKVEKPIDIDTGYGVLKIPIEAVKEIKITVGEMSKGSLLEDDFSGSDIDKDKWDVKAGQWSITDGELQGTGQSAYNTPQIHFKEEMEGNYSIEFEARDNGNQDSFGIMWNTQNASNANVIWFSGGMVYLRSGRSWWNQARQQWQLPNGGFGNSAKVKLEVKGKEVSLSVDGNEVGSGETEYSKGKVGFWVYSGQVFFKNFKITKE